MSPKFLADLTSLNLAPRCVTLGFCGSLLNVCLVPRKRSLVLSGFTMYELVVLTAPLGYVEKTLFQLFNSCVQLYQGKRQE